MSNDASQYTRTADLDVHETEDGLIVFDPATDRVHHLNYTAGALFALCQGTHKEAELADMMAELYGLEAPPVEVVETGLQQLVAEGVLVETRGD